MASPIRSVFDREDELFDTFSDFAKAKYERIGIISKDLTPEVVKKIHQNAVLSSSKNIFRDLFKNNIRPGKEKEAELFGKYFAEIEALSIQKKDPNLTFKQFTEIAKQYNELNKRINRMGKRIFDWSAGKVDFSFENISAIFERQTKIVVDKTERKIEKLTTATCASCGKADSFEQALKKCARCMNVMYCSKKCQGEHWEAGHKALCKKATILSTPLPEETTVTTPTVEEVD